jgi:hypothetical protein
MWQKLVTWIGVPLAKELLTQFVSWARKELQKWQNQRQHKKLKKAKKEINEAIKNRDAKSVADKLNKL